MQTNSQTALSNQKMFRIYGKVFSNPYDWGGNTLIPQTLGFTPEPGVPYAEYWIGTHEKAPATVVLADDTKHNLNEVINARPSQILGAQIAEKYSDVPFLYKLLDAKEMLSLQVHPNKHQAEEGYKREETEKIPHNDAKRTYKDTNHKPEFAVAQDDFWLLHGFQQPEELKKSLESVPELTFLLPVFGDGDYQKLYTFIMKEMPDEQAQTTLHDLAQRIVPKFANGQLVKTNPDYWAAKAIQYMKMQKGSYDRGLFSIYILNLVHLKPGDGIFQDAGLLHSYLQGPIIEIMATSDNVARGGITPKYIDITELLTLVLWKGITPHIIPGDVQNNERIYKAPIDEFQISRILVDDNTEYTTTSNSCELIMVLNGTCSITDDQQTLYLRRGESIFIAANTSYTISATKEDIIYKTSVPKTAH